MREVPRSFPIRHRISILTSGLFFWVGFTLLISGLLFSNLFQWKGSNWEQEIGASIFIGWGVGLSLYALLVNRKRLILLTWGKIHFGTLVKRDKSHTDLVGTLFFDCQFQFRYHLKDYEITLVLPDAQELEDGEDYLIFFREEKPEKAICLHYFSSKFVKYFHQTFQSDIKRTARNQGIEVEKLNPGFDRSG